MGNGELVFKNYDSILKTGMVFTNQRGKIKTVLAHEKEMPAKWISTYGSVTMSQVGREYPACGMNERGLVVEQATMFDTRYPDPDGKPCVSPLDLIQYLLDTCPDVETALEMISRVEIRQGSWPMHYYLCDEMGNQVIIEYLEGVCKIEKISRGDLVCLTNKIYEEGMIDLKGNKDLNVDLMKGNLLGFELHQWKAYLLETLKWYDRETTVWSNIYDSKARKIFCFSNLNQESVEIDLSDLDFSLGSKNLGIQCDHMGCGWSFVSESDSEVLASSFYHNQEIKKRMGLSDGAQMIRLICNQLKKYDKDSQIVLRFLEEGVVRQLPMKERYRFMVLEYLSSKFEYGVDYSEGQVNEIIDENHLFGDYFILRRELIDHQLLGRLENGSKYWRK